MYTVLLRGLPPQHLSTFGEAWDSRYLDARRRCLCPHGCRCDRYSEVEALLDTHNAVMLQAALVFIGDAVPEQVWTFGRLIDIPVAYKSEPVQIETFTIDFPD